jgi:hypothetical protein
MYALPFSNYYSSVVDVCVDFLCSDFCVQVDREIQDCCLSSGRRIDRLELLFCSSISFLCRLEVDHWQPTAPRRFNAQQICCCSSCLRLPLSSRADLIQINLLIIRLRPRLRCPRDELAIKLPQRRQRGERAAAARRRTSEPLREATAR